MLLNPLQPSLSLSFVSSPQALFTQVPVENVLTMHDVTNIWRVPILLESQGAHHIILKQLGLKNAGGSQLIMVSYAL